MFNLTQKRPLKTPTILQMEATECGAAALAIIFGYYGLHIPLEELRIACGVSRDGSKAINMLQVARRYGFTAQGAKVSLESLTELTFPVIAFWEFNHFVVIEGVDAKNIYLNDPAVGPCTISHDEFDKSYTGVMLLIEPNADFKCAGKPFSFWDNLAPHLAGIRNALTFITLLSLFLVVPGILIPGFTQIFIDDVLIQNMQGWLLPLLWGLLMTALLRSALSFFQKIHLLRLELKLIIANSAQFVWHVLRLPISFFGQRFAGDIESRIDSNNHIANWLSEDLTSSIVSLISMVFYGIILFLYDWTLAICGILIAIANGALLYYVGEQIANRSYRLQQELGRLSGVEMSGIQAIETIKATSSDDDFFQHWAGNHAKTLNSEQQIQLYGRILDVLPMLLNGLMTVVVLGLGGWRILGEHLSIGALVAFQTLLMSFNQPLLSLLGLGTRLQQLRGDITRLNDVNKNPEDPRLLINTPETTGEESLRLPGKLTLQQVAFAYSPLTPPVLNNISLSLSPGQRVAIVGASGSGKSTLARLICGLYQPQQGEIFLADIPLTQISAPTISQTLAFVDQDIFLFEGTILDNLTLWNDIDAKIIEQAIEDAQLETLLDSRLQGLESPVAHGGGNFSGGQRQQLEIARALISQPSLLILDEATSALDTETEQQIMQRIIARGISLFIVAHRLSTIRDADEIIVLHQGTIMERGTHEQLVQQQGYYCQLLQNTDGYADD